MLWKSEVYVNLIKTLLQLSQLFITKEKYLFCYLRFGDRLELELLELESELELRDFFRDKLLVLRMFFLSSSFNAFTA